MKVKRMGACIALGCIIAIAFLAGGKVHFSEYVFSYEVMYQEHSNTQVFFSEKGEKEFTEEKMCSADVEPNKVMTLTKSIGKENTKIRIDLGDVDNNIILSNLEVHGLRKSIKVNTDLITQENQIAKLKKEKEQYKIEVQGNDPYIIFDTESIVEELEQRQDLYNHTLRIIYVLLGVIMTVIAFCKFEKVKLFAFWFLDMIHEWRLIWKLALNDFKTKYVTSYLGTIWAFIQPIVTITIYVLVFGMGFKSLPVEDVPFAVWLTTGIVPWFFFQEAWMGATNSLLEYSYLVKKIVFKINVLPMVKIISSIFVHLFFVAATIILQGFFGIAPQIQIIQVIYYTFCVIVLALGVSYITSALVVFLKDVGQIVNILLQFGMWLTPIMYRVDMFGSTGEKILKLNPMFYIVDGYRDAFFQQGWFWEKPGLTLYFWCLTVTVLIVGIKVFNSLEKHFADVL